MTRRRSAAEVATALDRIPDDLNDSRLLRSRVLELLRDAIGFDWYAWVLTDPTTAVGTDPIAEVRDLSALGRLVRLKYATGVHRWTELADVARLDPATDADDDWTREVVTQGGVDVLSAVHRDGHGTWGFLDLWRGTAYDDTDVAVLRAILPRLTARLRGCRAGEFGEPLQESGPSGASVVLLDDDLNVLGATSPSTDVLRALLPTAVNARPVPASVLNVAAQLLAVEAGRNGNEPVARIHAPRYGLLTLRASRLDPGQQIAVAIQPTTLAERLDLFIRCHGLTPRESEVVRALAAGADTTEVARILFLSPHTVQDHLKSVFDRARVHSRRELLARAAG